MTFLTGIPKTFLDRAHYVAPYLFHLIATKKCRLFAAFGRNQMGRAEEWDDALVQQDNEYEMGVYNRILDGKAGIYSISFNHPCITKDAELIKGINVKKPFILHPKRLFHRNLNLSKMRTSVRIRTADEVAAEEDAAAAAASNTG